MSARHLDWEGCFNARDLGGLATTDGRLTRRGALVRADGIDQLTAAGWDALLAHGVRTIIDLRNDDERAPTGARPDSIKTLHLPLDAVEDSEFWSCWNAGWQCGTPLYYLPHLKRFPKRSAAVISAIAHADDGGVLVHCVGGRDRTGMIAMLVLALVRVRAYEIVTDYALSAQRLPPLFARRGEPDQGPLIEKSLKSEGLGSAAAVLRSTLAALDLDAFLREGQLQDSDVAALRTRMLQTAST